MSSDDDDRFVAELKAAMKAELRDRLDRQLRLQTGSLSVRNLFSRVAAMYERDIEAKTNRADAQGNYKLADALDEVQRQLLPEVIEEVRLSLPR